jgi:hypothetical protein
MDKFIISYYGTDVKKKIESDIRLALSGNEDMILIENQDFSVEIVLSDEVDFDEFSEFLAKMKKKTEIICNLEKADKKYYGKRKFLWKDGKVAFSQGGIRIEFDEVCIVKLKSILKVIKVARSKA